MEKKERKRRSLKDIMALTTGAGIALTIGAALIAPLAAAAIGAVSTLAAGVLFVVDRSKSQPKE